MLGLHAVGVFPELLLLKAYLGSFCVAARKWGVSMNILEFKVVIGFWCCDAKLMEMRIKNSSSSFGMKRNFSEISFIFIVTFHL